MRVKKDEDITVAVITVCALGLLAALCLGPCVAHAQTRGGAVAEATPLPQVLRVMEAKQPYEGGIKSKDVRLDEGVVIIFYNSGAVETNALKFANTPPSEIPGIESALMRKLIVDAATARFTGDETARLQLATAEARSALERTVDGGARDMVVTDEAPALEMNAVMPPPGGGGVVETQIKKETLQ